METVFRKAVKDDVPMILKFIKELAEYEKLAHQVQVTGDVLAESLFGSRPYAEVIFAVIDGKEAGFALFFNNFSTSWASREYISKISISYRSTGEEALAGNCSGLLPLLQLRMASEGSNGGC